MGHLSKEISRVTQFLMDRGAKVQAQLVTINYRKSPLVQGGLEIACEVSVKMPPTLKNHMLIDKYLELVGTLYSETKEEVSRKRPSSSRFRSTTFVQMFLAVQRRGGRNRLK